MYGNDQIIFINRICLVGKVSKTCPYPFISLGWEKFV